jgi:hypothetical protein
MPQNLERAFPDPNLFLPERRKEYRLDVRIPITVSGNHPKTLERFEIKTVTRNVTRYGACFELAKGLVRVGSSLTLALGKKFEAKCRVAWVSDAPNNLEVLGVEFDSVIGQWVLYDSQ